MYCFVVVVVRFRIPDFHSLVCTSPLVWMGPFGWDQTLCWPFPERATSSLTLAGLTSRRWWDSSEFRSMCAHTHTHTHILKHTHTQTQGHTHTHSQTHTYTDTGTHTHTFNTWTCLCKLYYSQWYWCVLLVPDFMYWFQGFEKAGWTLLEVRSWWNVPKICPQGHAEETPMLRPWGNTSGHQSVSMIKYQFL